MVLKKMKKQEVRDSMAIVKISSDLKESHLRSIK